ncbi:MAG: DUF3990 domain-containing protein [Lachnospiraceae bacterium]|nr:DUF3990 domain-containing protein [Lachnospiraceae bacterium]
MTIYHGSDHIIEKPEFGKGAVNNDYGRGFYCTRSLELAKEWACGHGEDGFANEYELDDTGLSVIDLNAKPYGILNWLAVLTRHRTYWQNSSISSEAKSYLQEHFFVDLSSYDIVKGYRADDSYFTFAQDFVSGIIPIEKLRRAMHLGELGEQIVLKSPKAFEMLQFIGSYDAAATDYYEKKMSRDLQARRAYRADKDTEGLNGLYIIDIIREGITNGDPRVQ